MTKYSEPDSTKPGIAFKKRKKVVKKGGGLSFDNDEEEDALEESSDSKGAGNASTVSPQATDDPDTAAPAVKKRGLKPNASISIQPKTLTKSALLRDAQLKESLRKEYLQIQEAVKATDFCLPFVFFDGKNAPGGVCRMKKGDFVWLFLDKARKVGATQQQGGGSRKDWARIGVDDLMLVRGEMIIPHVSVPQLWLWGWSGWNTDTVLQALRLPLLYPQPHDCLQQPTHLLILRRTNHCHTTAPPREEEPFRHK